MRGFNSLATARAPGLALALAIGWAPAIASAARSPAPPFAYNTSGSVDVRSAPGSVVGPAVLQYEGVGGATFAPSSGQTFDLGRFVPLPGAGADGQTTTFTDTPFEVQVRAPELDRTTRVPVLDRLFPSFGRRLGLKTQTENSLLIRGDLNGKVGPDGKADLAETVTSIRPGGHDLQTQDHVTHYTFPIRLADLKLPASWKMAVMTAPGRRPPAAEILVSDPTPTPEPSTIVIFAAALGGLALSRRRRPR